MSVGVGEMNMAVMPPAPAVVSETLAACVELRDMAVMPPAPAPPSATTWYAAHESERGQRERERQKSGDELWHLYTSFDDPRRQKPEVSGQVGLGTTGVAGMQLG